MPSRTKRVRFETEYNSSFKAFDPEIYTSPLIAALIDEPRSRDKTKPPAAGLKSNKFLKSVEPPLQNKSKADRRQDNESKDTLSNEKQKVDTKNKSNSEESARNKAKKNRTLEYKAGLKPDNSLEKNKFPVSEYQREYEWKKFAIGDSPLLNAEKIVFDSHTNIPRFIRAKVPRKTEYQSKFAETRRVAWKEKKENKDEHEESEDNPPSAVKRLLQTSHNPDLPFFPRGSANRVIHTEYQANFGSPKKYQYEEGIWLGAKPPHLLPDDQSAAGSNEHITNWFVEVLELREKARHYKTRAMEGNYFSREYLAQLDAELEQLYEEQSKNSKNKKKSGRGDAGSQSRNRPGSPENEDVSQQHSAGELGRPRAKHAWGDDKSSENIEDGKRVYRDLNEQLREVSLDSETCSSHSEYDPVHNNYEQDAKKYSTKQACKKIVNQKHLPQHTRHDSAQDKNNNRTKPSLNQKHWNETKPGHAIKRDMPLLHDESSHSEHSGPVIKHPNTKNAPKTALNQKHSPAFHGTEKPPQTIRRDAPLLQDVSPSNSEDSRLGNEPHAKTNETKPSLGKTVNRKPSPAFHGITKPTQTVRGGGALLRNISSGSDLSSELSEEPGTESEDSRYKSPDKFDIKYVQGMHSNDYEAPSTSVRSNCDSESLRRSGYNSDSYLSQSSLASRESVARETLVHAKKRKENFWK